LGNAALLRELVRAQPVAALGTLHAGAPWVSMVPYAVLPDGTAFVIHVSQLAGHTRDMLESPAVSLLVIAPPAPGVTPQERARVTVQGHAHACAAGAADYAAARDAYLARFPNSERMFAFADFSLFLIRPTRARLVGGFARATDVSAADLAAALEAP
jgi:putative heme iron utilization protein